MQILFVLTVAVMMLEVLLQPDEAVIAWTGLITLVSGGGSVLVIPWGFPGPGRVNRWSRAADRAISIFSVLLGGLILSAAVAWGMAGLTLEPFPAISGVLLVTALVFCLGSILLVGGLSVIGLITQGNEETRQWARSLSRTTGAAGSDLAQPDNPPP